MIDQINLTSCRRWIDEAPDAAFVHVTMQWFVALIDTAEAAIELVSHEDAQRDPGAVLDAGDRLRQSLARFTTTEQP